MSTESRDPQPPSFSVSDVQLRFVEGGKDGLLAWASCVIDGAVFLNNVAIRRGKDGRLMLTYPAKLTAAGTRYYLFNPISKEASAVLEDAILRRLAELAKAASAPLGNGEAG